ncbi:hypothetical protein PPYR_06880 [Photinus pyralis]|uniref:Protein adenylyltransferase Fic n=2 Tax=Photinus pyralis TaxID=7054 RepID=A0A1Y1KI47_PHOPY|nr:hypothetical protein PPYR_06707 [Photinus pyralis]KAB0799000.1 hypothetical protein PPYR_06880 [Photinus pyralis]
MTIISLIICLLIGIVCVLAILLQAIYNRFIYIKGCVEAPSILEDMMVIDYANKSEVSHLLKRVASDGLVTLRNKHFVTYTEMLHLLEAALAFKLSGNVGKAAKLLDRATSVALQSPDVLNRYGEFIEHVHNDIVAADLLYYKALTYCPNHKGALDNRKRSAPIVEKLDLEMLALIDKKRNLLQERQKTSAVYSAMKRKMYYLQIYHTVGLEGNTLTLDQIVSLLETGLAVQGKSLIEHNEILGVELAMNYVKLLIRYPTISTKEIQAVHSRVLGHVDPVSAGKLRREQVFVGSHVPPEPEDVPFLLEGYAYWLNSDAAHSLHPVKYAALAHYKLVDIHPFMDGNGRISRLIMNLVLLRTGYPPILIFKYQRDKYYQSLNLADRGDVCLFVRFIAECMKSSLELYLSNVEYMAGITHLV